VSSGADLAHLADTMGTFLPAKREVSRMRRRRQRGVAAILLTIATLALFLTAACSDGGDDESGSSVDLADRWIRVGEDARASVETYDRALPSRLVQLLNPGMTADSDPEDLISLPVHPEGELVGSFLIRRPDGVNLIWLIYDVPKADVAVASELESQLDQTPWQVIGGQANDSIGVVRFQSTVSGDIDGTAVVQPLPPDGMLQVVVMRDGVEQTFELEQFAPAPLFEGELDERSEGVVIVRLDPGAARDAGLQPTDRLVSVAGTPVSTLADVAAVTRSLGEGEGATSTITYILEIRPPFTAPDVTFSLPAGRELPESFPAPFLQLPGTVLLDFSWQQQAAGSIYQLSLVTTESNADVTNALRDAIDGAGWLVTDDRAFGFATVLQFEDAEGDMQVQATIDAFPPDETLTAVFVELQSARSN
jgi:hypothetical protein